MMRKSFAPIAAALAAALGLGACHSQHSIEGTQSQYLNVAGKRVKVDLKPRTDHAPVRICPATPSSKIPTRN
jgi:hypothetical protein